MNWYKTAQSEEANLPSIVVKQRQKVETYEECPHCKKEILEKSLFCSPDFKIWTHRSCGGKMLRD